MKIIALALAASVACAQSAAAAPDPQLPDGASLARLATPYRQPVEKLIDGRTWRCLGDTCRAGRQDIADSQPLWMECSDAAAELGTFLDYQTGSTVLEAAKLSRCNAHATAPAQSAKAAP